MGNDKSKKAAEHVTEPGVTIAKDGVQFTTASILRAVGTLLLLIVLARLLQPADFGLYSIVFALVTFLGLNTDYGLANALRKKLPETKSADRISALISNSYAIAVLVSLIVAAVAVALSGYIALYLYHNTSLMLLIILGAASIPFSALFIVTTSMLLGLRKGGKASAAFLMHAITQFMFSVIPVLLGYGVSGALFGMMLGYLTAFIFAFALLKGEPNWRFCKPQWSPSKEITYFSAPIFTANAAGNGVRNLGVLLLGVFVSALVIGNYSAAFRLGSFGDVVLGACAAVLLPGFSGAVSRKLSPRKIGMMFNNSLYYTLLLLLPILVYLISVSRPLIYLIFSSSYSLAPIYFPIMAMGIVAAIVAKYGGLLLIGYGKVKTYTKYQLGGGAIIVVILAVLTPLLHVSGVLISLFVISPIMLAAMFLAAVSKELKVHLQITPLLKLSAVSVAVWFLLTGLNSFAGAGNLSLLLNAVIVILFYPALLAVFKSIGRDDLTFMRKVGESMRLGTISRLFVGYMQLFIG